MKVKSESEVTQSCLTLRDPMDLCDPMDCSPPGSSIHGIFQAKYWSGVPVPSPLLSVIHTKQKITLGISKKKRIDFEVIRVI